MNMPTIPPRESPINIVRPPWSELYRWQRRAAVAAVIAVAGWLAFVGILVVVWVNS